MAEIGQSSKLAMSIYTAWVLGLGFTLGVSVGRFDVHLLTFLGFFGLLWSLGYWAWYKVIEPWSRWALNDRGESQA